MVYFPSPWTLTRPAATLSPARRRAGEGKERYRQGLRRIYPLEKEYSSFSFALAPDLFLNSFPFPLARASFRVGERAGSEGRLLRRW